MRTSSLRGVRNVACAAAIGAAFALAPQAAEAAFIAAGSDINLNGDVNILPLGELATNATGLDFFGPVDAVGEGDLAGFSGTGNATITDIPEGQLVVGYSQNSFYTVFDGTNTLYFDLVSITEISRLPVAGRPTVSAGGVGVFRLAGYQDTQATFVLTVQGDGTTTFSSSSEAIPGNVPAPEPVSMAIFGMGLLGLGAVMRRKA